MNLLQKAGRYVFGGYDAIQDKGKRKPPQARYLSEDWELRQQERQVMLTSTRDLQRNFCVAAWMIRKHVDYITAFTFQAKCADQAFNAALEEFIEEKSDPKSFDASARFNRARFLRLCEARRTLDGDFFINFLDDGRVQGIEGDRVKNPTGGAPLGIDQTRIINGVMVDDFGAAVQYAVHKRPLQGLGLVFDRMLSADFCCLHGYFDRYDQVRGISPLAPAINSLRDVYENFDYALAKAKVSQLFALAFYRDKSDAMGINEVEVDETGAPDGKYGVDFGKGPINLDLDAGDRAEFLESKQPSSEFQAFTNAMIMVTLKSLDIPFSFFDESHTNWVGQRTAANQYEQACDPRRKDNEAFLDRWTAWRVALGIVDGELQLPAGMQPQDVQWEWIHAGVPWTDPLKEVSADIASIGSGLNSHIRVCRERGLDCKKIIDEIAEIQEYAKGKHVTLTSLIPNVPGQPESDNAPSGKQKPAQQQN